MGAAAVVALAAGGPESWSITSAPLKMATTGDHCAKSAKGARALWGVRREGAQLVRHAPAESKKPGRMVPS
jgi:hypothetical protein